MVFQKNHEFLLFMVFYVKKDSNIQGLAALFRQDVGNMVIDPESIDKSKVPLKI